MEPKITYWKNFSFFDENTPGLGDKGVPFFDDGEIFFEPIGGYELLPVPGTSEELAPLTPEHEVPSRNTFKR